MRRLAGLLLLPLACASSPAGSSDASAGGSTTDATTGAGSQDTTAAPVTSSAGPDATATGAAGTSTAEPATTTSAGSTTAETGDATADATSDATTDATGDGGDAVHDPDEDGPWEIAEITDSVMVGDVAVGIDCFYPTSGPQAGPYPVVVVAHGFQLPPTQYTRYVQRLATHGYVALTADFKADLFNTDHVANAQQVLAGIDWAAEEPTLAGLADTANVGLTGHSLGGKLAIFGAVLDDRVRASITLDPVDGAQMCNPQMCPDVSDMLPTDIPLGFVGETLDGSGGFMPCAPAANNFLTFFAAATAPALAVTVHGANHMSFLDDVDGCGFVCGFCNPPTLTNDVVNALSRAYVVAFYGRHLKGEAGYDAYLTGAQAQARYVETGLVELDVK